MHSRLSDVVADHLPDAGLILAPGGAPSDLKITAKRVVDADPIAGAVQPATCAAALLLDGQLSTAGEHAEELVDAVAGALEPHGMLAASVTNRVYAAATGTHLHGRRGYSAAEVSALLHHRGFDITVLCAPGAAARLRGVDTFDLDADRHPGLLDAAPELLVIARAPRGAQERSRTFFRSRPRKIAAAAAICRDADGRLLVVRDRFQRIWTIPGGVVDAGEDPASAARRETWEEGGIKVDIGRLLGAFSGQWPDRMVFVFAAEPTAMTEHPQPVHRHEISDVAWLPVAQALDRVAPRIEFQVRRCLERPGHCWVQ